MQTEIVDGSAERRFLIAAIVSKEFLSRITSRLPKEPLRSHAGNVVLGWCLTYFAKHSVAPRKEIESLFATWAATAGDKDTVKLIDRFLGSLSDEYETDADFNLPHALDLGEKHLNEVALERLGEDVKVRLGRGDAEAALEAQQSFRRVSLTTPPFVDVLRDTQAQKEALESKQRILVRYPGAAGEFFGDELSEDSLVGFMAPMKGRKSYMMLDMAWRAMRQGQNVAYVQVGDLSKTQIMMRFFNRAVRRPLKAKTVQYPTALILPRDKTGLATVVREPKEYKRDVTWEEGERSFAKAAEASKGGLRLSYHPTRTIGVAGIKDILSGWDDSGYVAKVVILDYTENLANPDKHLDYVRNAELNWSLLRQLSEVRKCLVVTAAQAARESYRAWVATRSHFRNTLMAGGAVTAFFGLNSTEEEFDNELLRINCVVSRANKFVESHCCYLATCLDLADVCVLSSMPEY